MNIALTLLAVTLLAGCGFVKDKSDADAAVTRFHDLYNQDKLDVIWNEADPAFCGATPHEKYNEFIGALERKLGKVVSTSNAGWSVKSYNLKTRVHLVQETVFEHGKGTESFTFVMSGTNAVLLAYNIQSMDLITR
jgi:hypothetical protein